MGRLLEQLKHRNVLRVAAGYAVVGWMVIQVADTVFPNLGVPSWVTTMTIVLVVLGFPVSVIVSWIYEWTPYGVLTETEADEAGYTRQSHLGRQVDVVIIVLLAIAVGWLIYEKEKPEPTVRNSVAVLPFVNLTADRDQEYFSDGITEEIIFALSGVEQLKVAGRASSFAFKDRNEDLQLIGRTLGVEHILDGSVRRSKNTVRIVVQLVEVADGFQKWTRTFERDPEDIFAIQDEIASSVVQQLKARILDTEREQISVQPTDPIVYERYLLAKQHIRDRTRPKIELGIELLNEALDIAPDYAPALAQKGIAELLLSIRSYGSTPHEEAIHRARPFIERAIELDPLSAEGWAGFGFLEFRRGQFEESIAALLKARSINPNLIDAGTWLQLAYSVNGDARAGLELLEDMVDRDLLYVPAFRNAVTTLDYFGFHDKAQALIDRYRNYAPNDPVALAAEARHFYYIGRGAEAFTAITEAMQSTGPNSVNRGIYWDSLEATQQVERLANADSDVYKVNALDYLGRRDEALDAAEALLNDNLRMRLLFTIWNRTGENQKLVDYLEERWPTLQSYDAEHPERGWAYFRMVEIGVAYQRTGNTERYEQALAIVQQRVSKVTSQGLDNFVFHQGRAEYLALAGDHDAALDELELAVQQGWMTYPDLATKHAVFAPLRGHPRLAVLEEAMVININRGRAKLGLDPIDPDGGDW